MIPTPSHTACSLLLGAIVATTTTIASARVPTFTIIAPTARERSQLLVAEGDAAYAKDHLEEAVSKYRASYYVLSPDDQASYLGSLPVRKATRAYEQLIAKQHDDEKRRVLLQRQLALIVEFLDAIASKDGATEDVGEDVITEIEEKRHSIDSALAGPKNLPPEGSPSEDLPPEDLPPEDLPPVVGPTPPTDPVPDDVDEEEPADSPSKSCDWLGLGLVIGGSTTLLAGAGVSVGYFTIRSGADALIEAGGDNLTSEELDAYREREYARAQSFLIAGSVVGGVGLAMAVGGAVRLTLQRRHSRQNAAALHLFPIVTHTDAGLTLHRRF